MLAEERRREILNLLNTKGILRTAELCSMFDVSKETIRRDLRVLQEEGHIKKVYGGVIYPGGPERVETPFMYRERENREEKRKIGVATAQLIGDRETIIIDTGTTLREVARHIRASYLNVFTNSIPVALELLEKPNVEVYLIGGKLRAGELSLSGHIAEEILMEFHVDKAIVGAGGLSIREGLTDYHIEEASIRRFMIKASSKVIVATDHTKLGKVALANVAPLSSIHVLVTDSGISPEDKAKFTEAGIQVIIADYVINS
ncbi:MAG: DeoR/GlpR transcriptional regulator [Firmicutes bacterium]|nr:DeoR/GlpR transcriptional regulator [Bacillota bacterium]